MAKYPRIPAKLDGRRKLTEEDKTEIRREYAAGDTSTRILAREWGVSRRTIQFAIDPQKRLDNVQRRRERIARGEYQDYGPKQAEYMRTHRAKHREIHPEAIKAYEDALRTKSRRYSCEPCKYGPYVMASYQAHLKTAKHRRIMAEKEAHNV